MTTEYGDFNEVINLDTGEVIMTAEEHYNYWLCQKQINNYTPTKTNQQLEEENKQLWDTVNFLLKDRGFIPMESEA